MVCVEITVLYRNISIQAHKICIKLRRSEGELRGSALEDVKQYFETFNRNSLEQDHKIRIIKDSTKRP